MSIRSKNINNLTCLPVTFARISQSLFWRSLNATARWWFSNTLSSLYISASSEPIIGIVMRIEIKCHIYFSLLRLLYAFCINSWLTWIYEVLIGHARVVYIMNGRCKYSSKCFQRCKDGLKNILHLFNCSWFMWFIFLTCHGNV